MCDCRNVYYYVTILEWSCRGSLRVNRIAIGKPIEVSYSRSIYYNSSHDLSLCYNRNNHNIYAKCDALNFLLLIRLTSLAMYVMHFLQYVSCILLLWYKRLFFLSSSLEQFSLENRVKESLHHKTSTKLLYVIHRILQDHIGVSSSLRRILVHFHGSERISARDLVCFP